MKNLTILLMIASTLLLVERAEAGLVWKATARLSVTSRPALEGIKWVKARGIHRVTVTDMGIYTKLMIRVFAGSLEFNTSRETACSTDWVRIIGPSTVSCTTFSIHQPCEDGVWEAVTTGKLLIATMFRRTKIDVSEPIFVNCGCT